METQTLLPDSLRQSAYRYKTEKALIETAPAIWTPFQNKPDEPLHPQYMAYHSLADELFFGGAAGGGKALSLDTPIPTPQGYKTIGELTVGDVIYGRNGQPCRVIATSEIMHNHAVYDVHFKNGDVIRADADHKWLTYSVREREQLASQTPEARAKRRANRPKRGSGKRPDVAQRNSENIHNYVGQPVTGTIRTTVDILNTLTYRGKINHTIPVAQPLEHSRQDLILDPYILGAWLGDGHSHFGRMTISDEDLDAVEVIFNDVGWALRAIPSTPLAYTVPGLQTVLKELGVFKNKHIPDIYQYSSVDQRTALLQGLMDTDGTATENGQCEFYSSSKDLIEQVSQLLNGLSISHTVRTKKPPRGSAYNESYRIKFTAPFPVFRLPRKLARQHTTLRATSKWHYIESVVQVESEPVKCIAVDSPDRLFLAGRSNIPTHNTDLALGLAGTQHLSSIIFRRIFKSARGMIDRSDAIYGKLPGAFYNRALSLWKLPGSRQVQFAAMQYDKDKLKYQGIPRDLFVFDELTEFTEQQYKYVTIWNRTSVTGQRTRILGTGNPPTTPEGEWVIIHWGPWLDEQHPNPAEPGELRWFATVDGKPREVENGDPFEYKKETITPRSRTFIPSRVTDNPILLETGYLQHLQSLEEPQRSMFLYGDFTIRASDDAWQVIPTEWVDAAITRGRNGQRPDLALKAVGVDPSRGGDDEFTVALLWGSWFEIVAHEGHEAPSGKDGARLVLDALNGEDAMLYVDTIGYGASVYDVLMETHDVVGVNVGKGSKAKDRSGRYGFNNLRSQLWWRFREALNPENGHDIALPDSRKLRQDLRSARYQLQGANIVVESKDKIRERTGRSTDYADAVLMTWYGAMRGNVLEVSFI